LNREGNRSQISWKKERTKSLGNGDGLWVSTMVRRTGDVKKRLASRGKSGSQFEQTAWGTGDVKPRPKERGKSKERGESFPRVRFPQQKRERLRPTKRKITYLETIKNRIGRRTNKAT